jgi:hypothetical protein
VIYLIRKIDIIPLTLSLSPVGRGEIAIVTLGVASER